MPTEVAFSSIETIDAATTLGHVPTDLHQRIRVLADCRSSSDSTVEIALVLEESGGAPGRLDRYLLDPGESVQRVCEVPARASRSRRRPSTPGPAPSTRGSGATGAWASSPRPSSGGPGPLAVLPASGPADRPARHQYQGNAMPKNPPDLPRLVTGTALGDRVSVQQTAFSHDVLGRSVAPSPTGRSSPG